MILTTLRDHSSWVALVVCLCLLAALVAISKRKKKPTTRNIAVEKTNSTAKEKKKTNEIAQDSELLLYLLSSLWILYKEKEEDKATLLNKTTFTLGVVHLVEGFYKNGLPKNSVVDEIEAFHGSMSNWKAKMRQEIETCREASRNHRLKSGKHVKQKILPSKFFAPI